jgi:hypothetical protein
LPLVDSEMDCQTSGVRFGRIHYQYTLLYLHATQILV